MKSQSFIGYGGLNCVFRLWKGAWVFGDLGMFIRLSLVIFGGCSEQVRRCGRLSCMPSTAERSIPTKQK